MKLCKTLSKRGLALFLALMMCISLLPATAMAEELNAPQALCGLTEHTHGDDCYTTERKLTCTLPEDAGHTHDPAACYDETGAVICDQEEREAGHVHDPELCYADVRGDLICQLAEHVHTADCYAAAEDETDETDSGSMAPQAVSIREPVKIDPAALVEQNSEEGYISLYGLFTCASWAGWDEMWLDYGAFLAELTLEYADGTTQTIAFAPAMQDDASTPVLLTISQVYYNGEAVTVYAGTKVGEIEDTGALLETEITVAAGMKTTLSGEEDSYRNHKWQIKIKGNWTDIPYSGRGDGYDYSNSTVWVSPSGNTATVHGLKAGEVDIRHQIGGGDKWKTKDEYEVTVTASSAGNEDKTDVFLFLSLPTAKLVNNNGKMEYSGNASDYCFLGHGGNVYTSNPPAGKAVPNHQTLVNNPAQQNDVTKYVEHWPTALEPNITDTSSSPVGGDSTWTIDSATGKVSYFKLFVGNKWYSSDATQSDDNCAYEIRWVKFSYVGTDPSNVTNYGERYHIDGALFKVTTPGEIVDPEKPQEWPVVYKNLEEFYPAGTMSKDFQFQMYETDANGNRMVDSEFAPIDLVTTVTQAGVNTRLYFAQSSENRVNDHLIPSRYAIEEALTGDDAKIWQANKVRFQANPDGTINWLDANGNVIDNGNSAAAAASVITNRLRQYTVTGAIDHSGTVSLASQSVKYGSQSQAVTFTPADGRKITSVKVTVGNGTPTTITGDDLTLASDGTYTYAATPVTDNIKVEVATGELPRTYEVRYHENGGNWAAGIADPVPVTTDVGTLHTVGHLGNGVADPTHNDKMDGTTAVPVVFLGWTATQADAQAIISFGGSVPSSVIPKGNTTRTVSEETDFYAVWAEDRNNDREADVYEAKVVYEVENGTWNANQETTRYYKLVAPNTSISITDVPASTPNTAAGYDGTGTWSQKTGENTYADLKDNQNAPRTPVGLTVEANHEYTYKITYDLRNVTYAVYTHYVSDGVEVQGSSPVRDPVAEAQFKSSTYNTPLANLLPDGYTSAKTLGTGTDAKSYLYVRKEYKVNGTVNATATNLTVDRTEIHLYYELDSDRNNTPDIYDAKIIYGVDNGTWVDTSIANPKPAIHVALRTWDDTSKTWKAKTPVAADYQTPADDTMTANTDYTSAGAGWYQVTVGSDGKEIHTAVTPSSVTLAEKQTYTFHYVFQPKVGYTVEYYFVKPGQQDTDAAVIKYTKDNQLADAGLIYTGKADDGSNVTVSSITSGTPGVTVGANGASTVTAPAAQTIGTDRYIYRSAAPATLTVSNTVGSSNVIKVYYDLDNWTDPTQVEPGKPHDNIPDKYQVQIKYQVAAGQTDMGEIQGTDPNPVTVTIPKNGDNYVTSGTVTVPVRTAAVKTGADSVFLSWTAQTGVTWNAPAGSTTHWTVGANDAAGTISGNTTLGTVTGGNTYTFTANFEAKATVTYVLVDSSVKPTDYTVPGPDKVKKGTTDYAVKAGGTNSSNQNEKWTFDGWYTTYDEGTKTLSDKVTTATITVSDNMTLYGKWTRAAAATVVVNYAFQDAEGTLLNPTQTAAIMAALGKSNPVATTAPGTTYSYVGDQYDFSGFNPTSRDSFTVSSTATIDNALKGTYTFKLDRSSDDAATVAYTGTIPSGGLIITRTYQLEAVRGVEVTKAPASGQATTVSTTTTTVEGDKETTVSTVVNWTITVKNTGNVSATYDISDVLTSGETRIDSSKVTLTKDGQPLTNNQITVPKGAEPVTINASYTVQASDAGKQLVNKVIVSDPATKPTDKDEPTVKEEKESTPITVLPTVTVTKTPVQNSYILDENNEANIQWTITVTNTSEVKAEGLSFEDKLADGTVVSVTGAGLNDDKTFDLDATGTGASKTFTATYKATAATTGDGIINTVTVKKGNDPLATAEAQTGIKVIPRDTRFTVDKTVTGATEVTVDGKKELHAKSGDKLTYTITVKNEGNVPLTTTLTDVLKAGTDTRQMDKDSLKLNGTAATALTVTDLPAAIRDDSGNVTNDEERTAVFTYTYTVKSGDAGNDLVNTVLDDTTEKDKETVKVDKLTYRVTKTLELTDKDRDGKQLSGVTLKEGKLIIDKGADGKLVNSITLLYKITVTGDAGAAYSITDTGATPNTLTGTLDGADGATVTKDLYVTMAIGVAQNADGSLTFNNPNGSEGLSNQVTVEGGTTTGKPTDPDPAATFTVSYQYTDDVAASNRTDLTGDAYRTAIYKAGDTVTVAPAATAVGYTFSGWSYLERDNIGFDGKTFVMPEHEVVLVGKFTPIAYTMQYDLHGGTADSAFAKKENVEWLSSDNQIPSEIPTRDGYEFKGWYLDSTGDKGTTYVEANKLPDSKTYQELATGISNIHTTRTITLHAGWEEVAPTFEPKDDTEPAPNGGLVKSSDKAGKVVQPGEVITYKVEITPEKTKPATATEAAVIKGMVRSFTIKDEKLVGAKNIKLNGNDVTPTPVTGTTDTFKFTLTQATQEELTVTYDYTVVAADATPKTPAAGEKQYITNTATVTLKGDEESSDPVSSNENKVEYQEPEVSVKKVIDYVERNGQKLGDVPSMVQSGDTITWKITVTNAKDVDAKNVSLTDTFTIGGTSQTAPELTSTDKDSEGKALTSSDFTVPKNSSVTFTSSYKVQDADKGKEIKNIAVETGKDPGNDETSKITVEKSEYSIKKELTDASTSVKPGDTISYKITVTNTGNVDQENLVIADVLSYTDTSATGAPNGTIEMTGPASGVTWNATAKTFTVTKVAAEDKVEIVYTYTVTDQDAGHTIKNTAKVEADNVEEKNPPEVTVQGAYQVVYYFDNVPADEKTVSGNAAVDEDILTKAGVTIKEKETYNGKDYALDTVVNTATGKVVAGEAAKNTVKIYYKADTNKTGTPDDYEATVIYQIDGGTWADTKVDTDRIEYVPLRMWDTTAKEWKPLTGVKPTNIPEGKHTLDSVDPGKWGLGDEVVGKTNSANTPEPKDQTLEAEKVYIFKLSFEPLKADIEIKVPGATADIESSSYTWVYDGQAHTADATVTGAPKDADYQVSYSATPSITNAGKLEVTATAKDVTGLYKDLTTSFTLEVTPRPITITVNGASKTEGEADPVFTGGITAGKLVKEGDLGTISYVRTSNVNTTGTHTGILDAIYTANPNYAVTVIRGTLTINSSYTPPINIPTVPTGPTGPTGGTTTIEDEETPLANAVGLNDTDHFAYIIGYEDDTVRPLNNITRAEAVTIFFRLMTDEYRAANWSTENSFSDVSAGSWYNNAVSTVQKAGALEHFVQDEKFLPNQAITRAEFASIAAGFVDSAITGENVGDFSDTEGHWAALAIRKAVEAGWINGVGGNRFAPDETISRAEVMTMVNRMLDRVPDAEHMLPDMKKWTDNPEDAWYYEAVQEATNEHDYERDEMGIVETWTEILTARDWKALEAEWAANGGALTPAEPAKPAEDESETEPEKD